MIVDGKVPVTTVNQMLHVEIKSGDIDTIGGWLYSQHAALEQGERFEYAGLIFTVLEKETHRIRKIEIEKHAT